MRVAALAFILAAAFPAQPHEPLVMLRQWIDAVETHAAGEADAPLERITAWSAADYDVMRRYVEALVEAPTDGNPTRLSRSRRIDSRERGEISALRDEYLLKPRFDEFRRRAAVFHTDAAILGRMPLAVTPPRQRTPQGSDRSRPESRIDVRSADGLVDSFQLANPNWFFARDLLDAISIPGRAPIVAQWYRAVGAFYLSKDNLADAMRHFDQARRIVPDDPGVLYGEACFQEALGSPSVQNFARVTTLPNGFTLLGVFPPQTHFRNATALLKRALSAQPDFVEARLRLGRMLSAQQDYDASLPQFAQVIAGSSDPALRYYAYLFTGEAALALDRTADAQASYEHALELRPHAQAARLGLATALRASGDRTAANAAVMATLSMAPEQRDDRDDPWWNYYKGDAAGVEHLLDELRAPFIKPAR